MFNNNEFEFIENVLLSVNIKEEKFDDQDNIKENIIGYINKSKRVSRLHRFKSIAIYTSAACIFAIMFSIFSYINSVMDYVTSG